MMNQSTGTKSDLGKYIVVISLTYIHMNQRKMTETFFYYIKRKTQKNFSNCLPSLPILVFI